MDEEDVRPMSVSCLYNIVDLQRLSERENIRLSADTNKHLLYITVKKLGPMLAQKLVKNLVDRGEIEWDKNENYEVEAVIDYYKEEEDNLEYYLIKWRGWSSKYNSWEPREHLACEDLIAQYHKSHAAQQESEQKSKKRKLDLESDDGRSNKQHQIQQIMDCISRNVEDITPIKLLTQSPLKHVTHSRFSGLVTNGTRVPRFRRTNMGIYRKKTKNYRQLKEEIKQALKTWEKHLNEVNSDPAPIMVENNVDLEGPPTTFKYINDYKAGEGVVIPEDPMVGCECADCFDEKKQCCGPRAGAEFAYYKHGRVRVSPGSAIYECNKRCGCGDSCPNRVVQHGRRHKVCVFRTSNGRGWGVKAIQKIKKGCFVMEYVGEVLANEEAERRGRVYDAEGRTYLFDLDFNDSDCPYTVDAGFYGNVSHFVNHSCDPNLAVYGVWINHLDPRLPRIALFAKRDIDKGQELTFDYMMTGDTTQQSSLMGLLGSPHSRTGSDDQSSEQSQSEGQSELEGQSEPQNLTAPSKSGSEDKPAAGSLIKTPLPVGQGQLNGTSDTDVEPQSETSSVRDPERESVSSSSEFREPMVSVASSEFDGTASEAGSEMTRSSSIMLSPSPAMKYRIMCQCGASNCRKFLF